MSGFGDTYHGWLIGVDVGATSVKAGLFDARGHLTATRRFPVDTAAGGEEGMLDLLARAHDELRELAMSADASPVLALGIGIAGIVDEPAGVVTQAPQFPAWRQFAVRDRLGRRLGLPVGLGNDVNTMAWGELWAGAAKGLDRFLMLAIGSGLGGAWAVDGIVQAGAHGMAGEFGHLCVDWRSTRPCGCGATGCLESFVSQVGIRRTIDEHPDADFRNRFADLPWRRWPERLAELERAGDPAARAVLDDFAAILGTAIGTLLNAFDVETVLIGGGVGRLLPQVHERVWTAAKAHSFSGIHARASIRPVALWDEGAMIGGARLALMAHQNSRGGRP